MSSCVVLTYINVDGHRINVNECSTNISIAALAQVKIVSPFEIWDPKTKSENNFLNGPNCGFDIEE